MFGYNKVNKIHLNNFHSHINLKYVFFFFVKVKYKIVYRLKLKMFYKTNRSFKF